MIAAAGAATVSLGTGPLAARRQRPEQNFTCSQSRFHFLRQLKGSPQWAQDLLGRSAFFRIFTGGPL